MKQLLGALSLFLLTTFLAQAGEVLRCTVAEGPLTDQNFVAVPLHPLPINSLLKVWSSGENRSLVSVDGAFSAKAFDGELYFPAGEAFRFAGSNKPEERDQNLLELELEGSFYEGSGVLLMRENGDGPYRYRLSGCGLE